MNPLTNVKNITKLNEIELAKGTKKSWHDMYKDSAWIFIGGLPYDLTEGDILAVFSQYGEIVNINLVRDKKTGKTKGFCFLCYANQKSTILAVDNLNAIKLCSRTIRVDHVANYKPPKEDEKDDELTKMLKSEGCAPKPIQSNQNSSMTDLKHEKPKKKKIKKEKKERKKKKMKHSREDYSGETLIRKKVKEEKHDPGYDKYDISHNIQTIEKRHSAERRPERCEGSSHRKGHKSDLDEGYYRNNSISKNNIRHRSNSSEEQVKDKTGMMETTRHISNSSKERVKDKSYMEENMRQRSKTSEDRDRTESSQYRNNWKSRDIRYVDKTKQKRSRSSSSDSSSSSSSEDTFGYEGKISKLQSRHTPDNFSTESSSDGERHKLPKKDKYRMHSQNSYSHESSKNKHDYKRDSFTDNRCSENELGCQRDAYLERKSRDRYHSKESFDKYSSNFRHSKSKYEKR